MKRWLTYLFSMRATALLLVIFAVSIGYATFIESDFGAVTAKIQVYDSLWFKVLLSILSINLAGSVIIHKLITRKKWTILLFHFSFLIILAGGGITRYTGDTGMMHIREGMKSEEYISDETYLTIDVTNGQESRSVVREVKFSERTSNRFRETINMGGKSVRLDMIQFIPSANESIVVDEAGGPLISLVATGTQNQRLEFILEKGEEKNFNNIVIGFEKATDATTVLIREKDGALVLMALNNILSAGTMGTEQTQLPLMEEFPLNEKIIYQIGHIRFILTTYITKGRTTLVQNPPGQEETGTDALRARISVENQTETIDVYGSPGLPGQASTARIQDFAVSVSYGSILKKLPFSLYLNDFQVERYPGSNSPSSFVSNIILEDPVLKKKKSYRIYMNNTLKYKGYRFFQSSHDADEQGTILSVNHDSWGTSISYAGYALMILGMLLSLFNRNSRFQILMRG